VAYHINVALFHSIPFTQADLGDYLEILTHCDTTPLKGEWYPSIPLLFLVIYYSSPCWYVLPCISDHVCITFTS
jgi:hypothetical protein